MENFGENIVIRDSALLMHGFEVMTCFLHITLLTGVFDKHREEHLTIKNITYNSIAIPHQVLNRALEDPP